jgi:hypothetical protein
MIVLFCQIKLLSMGKHQIQKFMYKIPASQGCIFYGAVYGAEQSLLLLRIAGGYSAP